MLVSASVVCEFHSLVWSLSLAHRCTDEGVVEDMVIIMGGGMPGDEHPFIPLTKIEPIFIIKNMKKNPLERRIRV